MTGTYVGDDNLWRERVKKEVKTQMKHYEDHDIVNDSTMGEFYCLLETYAPHMILRNMKRKKSQSKSKTVGSGPFRLKKKTNPSNKVNNYEEGSDPGKTS